MATAKKTGADKPAGEIPQAEAAPDKPTVPELVQARDFEDLRESVVGNLEKPKDEAPKPAARKAPKVEAPRRPGLVNLVALTTVAAHGMPHLEGETFSATTEVAERLLKKKLCERV